MEKFEDLKKHVHRDWRNQAKFREAAREEYEFVAGHQWTEEERYQMEEDGKPIIVFNRTAVILSSVAGSEINNRTEVRYIPREIGDVKVNEVLSSGAEWFRDASNAEDEESEAFYDSLICGMGWTETTLDFETDDEGEPVVNRVDPLEMGWDSTATRKGLTDSRRMFRVREMNVREALDMFEGYSQEQIDASWISDKRDMTSFTNETGDEYRGPSENIGENRDTVTVVQVQWLVKTRAIEYINPQTGTRTTIDRDRWSQISKAFPVLPAHRTVTRTVWKQAFLGNTEILGEITEPSGAQSTFQPITGHYDRKEKRFYGLLRSMRDPQKFANKWLSQTLHILNSNAKGGVIALSTSVDDPREFEESWAAADGVTWVKNMEGVREKPKAQMPAAFMQLTEFAISAIRDASGVNMELLGLRDANQAGVLEYQRRESAMTTLARHFDALRYYRKRQGQVILSYLTNYIAPTGRLVRILKDGQEQYVPLALESDTIKYDVIIDDAPSAPNEKEKVWSVMQAMMPLLQNAGLSMEDWADILEYSPLPSSLVEKVRAKATQQTDPEQQRMMQEAQALEFRKLQAETEKLESEAVENTAEAQLDMARAAREAQMARIEPMEALSDIMGSPVPGASAG